MEAFYIRKCLGGKSFAASADADFKDLTGQKSPFTGRPFEEAVEKVTTDNAEKMGVNFEEVTAALQETSLYFGRFRINLGETIILDH